MGGDLFAPPVSAISRPRDQLSLYKNHFDLLNAGYAAVERRHPPWHDGKTFRHRFRIRFPANCS
jgi:hypothetical protein